MPNAATLTATTIELVERLILAAQGMPLAMSNLRDAMPGFPTSTPGANAGTATPPLDLADLFETIDTDTRTGIGRLTAVAIHDEDRVGQHAHLVKHPATRSDTVVERNAGQRDPARVARDRIIKLVERLHAPITELYSLVETWDFVAARPRISPNDEHEWCTSCLRLDRCEPRAVGQYAELCRWCGDFKATEGRLPSTDLLAKRHDGVRITAAMVKADHPIRRRTKKGKRARPKAAAA